MMRPDITISVLGMWQFDNTLFDKFQVPEQIDKQDVIESILLECAELSVVYTNWDVLKGAIGLFSKRRIHSWERMADAIFEKYNPLHNYDRYEDATTDSTGSANSVNTVNGYNGDAEHDRQNTKGNSTSKHNAHFYGNIGVTTSAQMLNEELNVRKHDLISIIVREFKENFCVMLY